MTQLLEISLRQYIWIDHEEDIPRRDILKKIIILFNLTDEEVGKYIKGIVLKLRRNKRCLIKKDIIH